MPDFYHVGLTVRSIEDSYAFYHEVVGLEPCPPGASQGVALPAGHETTSDPAGTGAVQFFQVQSDAFDTLTNNSGSEIKFLYLTSPAGGFTLQLIEYVTGGGGDLALAHNRNGSVHFSFFVPDVDRKRREVEARGDVKITSDVIRMAPNMRNFYVEDPDGVPVEFLEVE